MQFVAIATSCKRSGLKIDLSCEKPVRVRKYLSGLEPNMQLVEKKPLMIVHALFLALVFMVVNILATHVDQLIPESESGTSFVKLTENFLYISSETLDLFTFEHSRTVFLRMTLLPGISLGFKFLPYHKLSFIYSDLPPPEHY